MLPLFVRFGVTLRDAFNGIGNSELVGDESGDVSAWKNGN